MAVFPIFDPSLPPPQPRPDAEAQTPLIPKPYGILRRLSLIGVILVLIFAVGITVLAQRTLRHDITSTATLQAQGLGRLVSLWIRETALTSPQNTSLSLLRQGSGLHDAVQQQLTSRLRTVADVVPLLEVTLYDGDGTIVYSSDDSAPREPQGLLVRQGFTAQQTFVLFGRTLTSRAAYAVSVPFQQEGGLPSSPSSGRIEIILDVQRSMDRLDSSLRTLMAGTAVLLGGLFAGLLLLGYWADRHALRVLRLSTSANNGRREAELRLRHVQDAMESTISERTQRLKQSEARFREFAESASDWLWECDENGTLTYVSEGFTRIMGLDRSVVLGRQRWSMSETDPDDTSWQAHRLTLSSMRPFRDFTYTFRMPNNRCREICLNGTPIFDDRARFCGFRGTGADVTDQHEAKQTILHLGRILEQSASEVFIIAEDTLRILQANRGGRQNLGYSAEELASMTVLDILPTESRSSLESRLGRVRLYPSELAIFETLHQRKDGSRYPVEARIQYIAEETPPVFVAVVQNITARKQAEQALAESEERYRSVAEMSLDAIIVHVDGVIVFANQQATTTIAPAARAHALMGQPVTAFVRAEDRTLLSAVFFPTRPSGRSGPATIAPPKRTELTLQRADGSTFEAELSSLAITFGGRMAVQTVLRDITDRKVVQGQLIQTAKLATLGEMAAGMAHELSQPMNVIRMAAEGALLDRADGSPLDAASRSALDIICGQAARMGEIIDHMRIFSRKQSDDVGVFDPVQSVREAVAMVESQLRAEDISVTVTIAIDDALVCGRPVHLEQVLLNLLTNGRDSLRSRRLSDTNQRTQGGGTPPWQAEISVSVSESQLPWIEAVRRGEDASPPSGEAAVEILVRDSGEGIPASHLDRIFEPFYTTKEVGTGTGLGLSVSFSLITSMRGTIEAFNLDDGAAFRIVLPLAAGVVDDHDDHPPRPLTLPPSLSLPRTVDTDEDDGEHSALVGHVMVVDDEPLATTLVRDHLIRLGYRVSTADNGDSAYDLFLNDPPDLLITDLRMPRCDGAELIRRIHQQIPDLPVIVVTGHLGHLEAAASDLQEVTVAVLKKPTSLAQLGSVVKQHINLPAPLL